MTLLRDASIIVLGYAIGCFATGYYLVRWRLGRDVREVGSKTIGALNVARVMGKPGFFITLAGDIAKGALALGLARLFNLEIEASVLVLAAVVLGHDFPIQLGFRGGNGLATAGGGLLIFDPPLAGALAVLFGASLPVLWVLLKVFQAPIKYYTPSKITVLATPLLAWMLGREAFVIVTLVGLVLIIMFTIRRNMQNLAEAG